MKEKESNSDENIHLRISSAALKHKAVEYYNFGVDKFKFHLIRDMNSALNNASPTLADIHKKWSLEKDTQQLPLMLQYMVGNMARSFNIVRNLDKEQIPSVAQGILTYYGYFKLSEVYFIFEQAAMGRYGTTYQSMDKPTIMGWFEDYAQKRMEIFEEKSMLKHDQYTNHEKSRGYDGLIVREHLEAKAEQDKRIMNLAYGMAKKMSLKNQPGQITEATIIKITDESQTKDQAPTHGAPQRESQGGGRQES